MTETGMSLGTPAEGKSTYNRTYGIPAAAHSRDGSGVSAELIDVAYLVSMVQVDGVILAGDSDTARRRCGESEAGGFNRESFSRCFHVRFLAHPRAKEKTRTLSTGESIERDGFLGGEKILNNARHVLESFFTLNVDSHFC